MRARHGANTIKCIAHIGHPIAQRIIHRIFEGTATRGYGNHFSAEQFHPKDVWRLTLHIMGAHIDHALQAKLGADRRGCNAMLPSACFSNNTRFPHSSRQNNLSQHVVDFMRTRVVQLVAFHIDFRTAQVLGQPFREI